MPGEFPHLADSMFPNAQNIDVYKYKNEFDYTRFDAMQMHIQLCTVPWDMGEAHIGNRTISGIGNVVYFDTKEKRDEWLDAIPDGECYRFDTKYKDLHYEDTIDIPIPFDMAAKHNYIAIHYEMAADDGSPVEYQGDDGLRDWFYFVREVEMLSPNTTRLHVLADAWQTFIYDLNVSNMVLERGHAPMFDVTADEYLSNPSANCRFLLADDVSNDRAVNMSYCVSELVFNDSDLKAVIIANANAVNGLFGSKTGNAWRNDARRHFYQDGVPSFLAFATDAGNIENLISNISDQIPQFMQSIKGIFFISAKMLDLVSGFTFCDIPCNRIASSYNENTIIDIDADLFGFDDRYKNIAKLYTYPYSYIEIADELGDPAVIKIETTTGRIDLATSINLAFPFINITAHLIGVGRGNKKQIAFGNITVRNMPIQGNWYETVRSWDIPCFGVVQDAGEYNDYATHYERQQSKYAATNAYDSAIASAEAARDNAYASNAAAKGNADADADTLVDNTDIQIDTANLNRIANNQKVSQSTAYNNSLITSNASDNNLFVSGMANLTGSAAQESASVGANAMSMQAGLNAAGQVLKGDFGGAIGTAVSTGISADQAFAQASISANLSSAQANLQSAYNTAVMRNSLAYNADQAILTTNNNRNVISNNNDAAEGTAANSAATMKGNASRSKTAADANALRTYNTDAANAARSRSTSLEAIDNQIRQKKLNAPQEFGAISDAENALTRPLGLFAHIVTQDDYSIEYAADSFIRYGYMLNKQWDFDGNWNIGKYFTYWKLSDFWVSGLNIPDLYVDKIRFFLFGGVTVWRKPEYIGRVNIYENID